MSFNFDVVPVQIFLSKADAIAPKKCTTTEFNFKVSVGMGAPKISGDPLPLIQEHAQKGWLLKGALSLPPKQKGVGMTMGQLLCFEAPAG
jgi:hypothetical protein